MGTVAVLRGNQRIAKARTDRIPFLGRSISDRNQRLPPSLTTNAQQKGGEKGANEQVTVVKVE